MDLTQAAQSGLSLGFHSSPIPLQLLDQKPETRIDNEENQTEDEQFSILGHQMCIKRPRDNGSQSSSTTNSSKRVAMDPGFGVSSGHGSGLGETTRFQPQILRFMRLWRRRSKDSLKLLDWILINGVLMCSRIPVLQRIFAVYTGLLLPGDRIMGLDSPSGGHLSHGYYTPGGKKMEEKAMDFRPKILICGGSSYPREWDYARFRQVSDKIGAVLMCDMAHISGLVAAKECVSPFEYCDIVTSTTHKSLRGPRGGIIFYRKGPRSRKQGMSSHDDGSSQYDFEEKINFAVHPSLQGGPHNNHIAALAIALKQVATPEYKAYMQQVRKNAQALASALLRRKCKLVTGGTDNHLVLWDLTTWGLAALNGTRFNRPLRYTTHPRNWMF
ncbi:SERINE HYDROXYMETHYLTRANSFERASE [Salix viminalis]|uniref:SERINE HYDROXYMETHYLTRANSFERASE n=1 Tax=Salix viminalis TaxID=40686 RepID=A0A9Q0UST5_SALVM|nr:SERINE HYDROXYMETHYLTRANSFERASE [Salix viminalis]